MDKDLTLNERAISWSKKYNMLYIDQPAGTGFSFTDDPRGYANNQYDVARDLYQALSQFYKVFPERLGSDFYVTGESYAGLDPNFISKFNENIECLLTPSKIS